MKMIISLACITGLVMFGFVAEEQPRRSPVQLKKVDKLVFKELKTPDPSLISELNTLKSKANVLKRETNYLMQVKKTTVADTIVTDSLKNQTKRKGFIPRLIERLK